MKKTGIELIAQERTEMVTKHGFTVMKDVAFNSKPVGPFKMLPLRIAAGNLIGVLGGVPYPPDWDKNICERMQAKSEIDKLVHAGAFIAAEIDRLLALSNSD